MRKELEQKLFNDFPSLYKGRDKNMRQSLMCFGFMCGDGWFDLIYDLSSRISALDPEVEAMEAKEKFGTLRYYINGTRNEKVFDLISEAEERSGRICEICGKSGHVYDDGWVVTRCKEHVNSMPNDL